MKPGLLISILLTLLASCKPHQQPLAHYKSDRLKIEPLSEKVYLHTSYLQTESFGKVPCNGLIYIHDSEALIFDTPVGDTASAELLSWLKNITIKGVVVTHFHIDCLGGLNQFHTNNIPSYATSHTIALALANDSNLLPQLTIAPEHPFEVGNTYVLTRYFGAGHTADNIVGYIPDEKTLFGGCLIKSLGASRGNLADADTTHWPITIKRIKEAYPELTMVVPGHGQPGNSQLLDYTIGLFTPPQKASSD